MNSVCLLLAGSIFVGANNLRKMPLAQRIIPPHDAARETPGLIGLADTHGFYQLSRLFAFLQYLPKIRKESPVGFDDGTDVWEFAFGKKEDGG